MGKDTASLWHSPLAGHFRAVMVRSWALNASSKACEAMVVAEAEPGYNAARASRTMAEWVAVALVQSESGNGSEYEYEYERLEVRPTRASIGKESCCIGRREIAGW